MMNRNEFLRSSASFAAAMFGIGALAACKDDGGVGSPDATAGGPSDAPKPADAGTDASPGIDASTGMASCSMNGTLVAIGGNHGHTLVVSKADVAAGTQKMYSIRGASAHNHTVVVTAAQFAMLAANTSISLVSTPTDHSHPVTVSCAAA